MKKFIMKRKQIYLIQSINSVLLYFFRNKVIVLIKQPPYNQLKEILKENILDIINYIMKNNGG